MSWNSRETFEKPMKRSWYNTINRADLSEAVRQKMGLSRTESATLVEDILKEITDCLERGENVKLASFGTFLVRKKGQRVGRNPKTGEEALIKARQVIVFKPSGALRRRVEQVLYKSATNIELATP